MRNWALEPTEYAFRVEFEFVDAAGNLLQSKTWELRKGVTDPARSLLVQADAKLLSTQPEMTQNGNFIRIKVLVAEISGGLFVHTFRGFVEPKTMHSKIAEFPLTLGIVLEAAGLHFSMYVAKPKGAQS